MISRILHKEKTSVKSILSIYIFMAIQVLLFGVAGRIDSKDIPQDSSFIQSITNLDTAAKQFCRQN